VVSDDGTHKAVNDIRYVSLSDLHLGAENSILTRLTPVSNGTVKLKADPTTASDVMIRLVDCLRLETQYIEAYLLSTKWGDNLNAPWHTTNMFLGEYDPVPCYLLDRLMTRYEPKYEDGSQPRFLVVYPNFGVRRADGQKWLPSATAITSNPFTG
jgi:hypothetical protein